MKKNALEMNICKSGFGRN